MGRLKTHDPTLSAYLSLHILEHKQAGKLLAKILPKWSQDLIKNF